MQYKSPVKPELKYLQPNDAADEEELTWNEKKIVIVSGLLSVVTIEIHSKENYLEFV